ncbi:MAG: histidine phosphatase family protein [Sphingomonadales bacterium]|nr:histidine phosphatase family protein [Sphingomonadales bacterium]
MIIDYQYGIYVIKMYKLPEREFVFLRHGQTDYNLEGRLQGRIDVPLNANGLEQAQAVMEPLQDISIARIVSSPARRVLQTVRPYRQASEIPIDVDDNLMEYFVGELQGQLISSIRERYQLQTEESWLLAMPEDAECWREFVSRVCSAVQHWLETYPQETILFASHGLVFHALTEALVGTPLSSHNGQLHCFSPTGDGWAVAPVSGPREKRSN